jgi:hypothetical protein
LKEEERKEPLGKKREEEVESVLADETCLLIVPVQIEYKALFL